MIRLTAIIIAKNAESLIADCLDSVRFCDEVIVIDNGSVDRTVDIAQQFKAKVIHHSSDNFAEQRNIGLKKAKGKWILYVDVDERVDSKLQNSIEDLVDKRNVPENAFYISRKNFYYGKYEWPNIEKILRIFKRDCLEQWIGQLHETPQIKGSTGTLKGYLDHYTHQDLSGMVDKTNFWSEIEADLRLSARHPQMQTWRFFRVMTTAFYDSYIRQRGYRAGTIGIIESIYQAFSMFITYAKLWERQMKQ